MHTTRSAATRLRPVVTRTAGLGLFGFSLLLITACGSGGFSGPNANPASTTAAVPSVEPTTTVPAPQSSTVITFPPTTPAPASTQPAPTIPPTTQPATTTPAPVPSVASGLLDLGKGVGVAVPAGWTGTNNNGVVKLTDGRLQITLVVLKRAPGEHPKDIVDEFVGLLIDPAGPADYSTCSLIWNTDAPRPAMEYELFYALQVQNGSIQGGLHTFIRDDGLTLLYDVWAPTGVTGALPDDVFVDLVNSFLDAPQLATPAALTMVPQFEVTTIHPQS